MNKILTPDEFDKVLTDLVEKSIKHDPGNRRIIFQSPEYIAVRAAYHFLHKETIGSEKDELPI
jgi:hypothetical protein